MSLLINNELIWVSIPKNASYSVEHSLLTSNLRIEHAPVYYALLESNKLNNTDVLPHPHVKLDELKRDFGDKETFCIKRDPYDRFIAGIEFIFSKIITVNNHTPVVDISEIDNNFIYSFFDFETINNLYDTTNRRHELWFNIYCRLIKEELDFSSTYRNVFTNLSTILSQNYWTNCKKCTYEFDILDLDKYTKFINKKFNVNIEIEKLNTTIYKNKSGIINNIEFKNWVYNSFEKRFDINNRNFI